MTLATKTSIPCKGGVPRLDRRQAEDLIDGVEAWELNYDATRISRTFKFPNFVEAQALATRTETTAKPNNSAIMDVVFMARRL